MTQISDALDTLRTLNLAGLTASARQYVHTFVWNFVESKYPARNAGETAYKIFNNSLRMNFPGAGSTAIKGKRSVAALAWQAIGEAALFNAEEQNAKITEIKNLAGGLVDGYLLNVLLKARLVSDQKASRDNGAREMLTNTIKANPLAFLQENRIMIYGSTANDVSQGDRNLQDFRFSYNPRKDRFEFKPANGVDAGAYEFKAVSVPATLWASVPGRGNYPPPPATDINNGSFATIEPTELAGASDFMVTTQFTGCSFCFRNVGGTTVAAHIAPSDMAMGGTLVGGVKVNTSIDPTKMAKQLCGLEAPAVTGGNFVRNGGANFRVYGKGHGNGAKPNGYPSLSYIGGATYMCILGVKNPNWRFYAQTTKDDAIYLVEDIT